MYRYNDSIAFHDIACYHRTRFICEDSELLLQEVLEIKDEESANGNEESTTEKRAVEVESTSKRIEVQTTTKRDFVETTTRKIEPENTSRAKTVETTESKVGNAKKTNQSDREEDPKKPQRRRKIVRKKLQSENSKGRIRSKC
jgi:hypothetical protein